MLTQGTLVDEALLGTPQVGPRGSWGRGYWAVLGLGAQEVGGMRAGAAGPACAGGEMRRRGAGGRPTTCCR